MLVYIAKSVRFNININIIFYFYKTNIFKQYITGCFFLLPVMKRHIHAIRGFLMNWILHLLFAFNQVAEQFGFGESSWVYVCVILCVCVRERVMVCYWRKVQ